MNNYSQYPYPSSDEWSDDSDTSDMSNASQYPYTSSDESDSSDIGRSSFRMSSILPNSGRCKSNQRKAISKLTNKNRMYWTEVFRKRKDPIRPIGTLEARKHELFSLINQHRAENGRPPLRLSKTLSHIARLHTEQQARMGRYSSKGCDYITLEDRMKDHNIKYQHLLYTDAEGQENPAVLHQELVDSPDTSESLLSLDVDEVGIHACKGKYNRLYWTEVFCRRLIDPARHPGLVETWKIHLFNLINEFRYEHHRAPLRLSARLSSIARLHNEDQALRIGDCSHIGSDGSSLEDRLERHNVKYIYASENVAVGLRDPADAHRSFSTSPGHMENMLSPTVEDVGLHVCMGKDDRLYWTELFCERR